MSDQFWSLFTSESASDPDGAADGLELAEREGYSAILGDVRMEIAFERPDKSPGERGGG